MKNEAMIPGKLPKTRQFVDYCDIKLIRSMYYFSNYPFFLCMAPQMLVLARLIQRQTKGL